jgi:lipooligosaccharide transport system ATP-binding protein
MVVIKAENLTKKFNNFIAVNNISFEIKQGECFGFLGPNGAGKTTTVKMIHCISPVTSGSIIVLGEYASIDNRKIKMQTGVIPQEINLDPSLTVYENLLIFSKFFDIPSQVAKSRINELLDFIEMASKRNTRIDELSTGMKRRVLIARALINNPKIIVADEPTTGLDPQARHMIWQRLHLLKKTGTTLILTTQYMEEAENLCDRLVIMYKGKILKYGEPRTLIEKEIGNEVIELRISKEEDKRIIESTSDFITGHERFGDVLYLYCNNNHEITKKIIEFNIANFRIRPATLEDVFLKLTGRSLIE